MKHPEFPLIYGGLLSQLMDSPYQETNKRTKVRIKVLPSGTSFVLDLSDNVLPTPGLRKVFPHVAAAELAWFLAGEQSIGWLNKYAPRIWEKFVEDGTDGVLNAYGYRWRRHFGRDQISDAVDALKKDKSDRRVYIAAWDPGMDGLGIPSKNVPCPVGFSLYVVEDTLHLAVTLRSLDTFVGLPYDVMDFALLLRAFACELGMKQGTLRLTAHHVHLYEDHWEMAEECLRQESVTPPLLMPRTTVLSIPFERDDYVMTLRENAAGHSWPAYAPKPEVIQ